MKTRSAAAVFALLCLLAFITLGADPNIRKKNEAAVAAVSATAETPSADRYSVARIVDGDTFIAERDGVQEKVRLIGLDTPETVDPRKTVQCFGHEASARAKELLTDTTVRLETDPSQDERDRYGRLLAYAYLPDGTLFNLQMIEEGYGHEYTYRIPYLFQTKFKAAERAAREGKRGLWADDACAD